MFAAAVCYEMAQRIMTGLNLDTEISLMGNSKHAYYDGAANLIVFSPRSCETVKDKGLYEYARSAWVWRRAGMREHHNGYFGDGLNALWALTLNPVSYHRQRGRRDVHGRRFQLLLLQLVELFPLSTFLEA